MSVSVDDLLEHFPDEDGTFTLEPESEPWEWKLSELLALLKAGTRLVVEQAREVNRTALSFAGTVQVAGTAVALQVKFAHDQARKWVTGLSVRVEMDTTVAALAELWGVELADAPLVFLADLPDLSLVYDFDTGSVVAAAESDRLRMVFAAPSADEALVALIGLKDVHASSGDLPYLGEELPEEARFGVRGLELLAVAPGGITDGRGAEINAAVAAAVLDPEQWWPTLPDHDLEAGLWAGAFCLLPGGEMRLWVVRLETPSAPPSWMPDFSPVPLPFGPLRLELTGFGLSFSAAGLHVVFEAGLDLGWLTLELPELGFDFAFPEVGDVEVVGRLPKLSLRRPGGTVCFDVGEVPGFPGLPDAGLLTGWSLTADIPVPDLLGIFGITMPSLPDWFTPRLPKLGLRLDLKLGDFALVGESEWLRVVLGGLPALPEWGTQWGKVALLGVKGLNALLPDLPFIGDLLGGISDFLLNGISLTAIDAGLSLPQVERLNGWLGSLGSGSWWPRLPEGPVDGTWRPGISLDLDWKLPGRPSVRWGIPWPPQGPPDLSWLPDIPDLALGPLHLTGIGLSWPDPDDIDWTVSTDWVLRLVFDATFDLGGGFSLGLPGLGFDFDLKNFRVHPRFPGISLALPGGFTMDFAVPTANPPWPESVTGRWHDEQGVSATDIARFLGVDVDDDVVPEALNPRLTSAGLYYNFRTHLLVVAATTEKFAWAVATTPANTPQRRNIMALRTAVQVRASNLPVLVETPEDADIILGDIHLAFAEHSWSRGEIERLNGILADLSVSAPCPLPEFLPGDLDKGLQLWAVLRSGGARATLAYPDRQVPVTGQEVVLRSEDRPSSRYDLLGYVIGAVRFSNARLGFGYGLLYLAFDASMTVGPLVVDLIGLGVGLDKDFNARPVLQGAAVAMEYKGPPKVEISGALVNLDLGQDFDLALAGAGRVDIQNLFTLQVSGSWARNKVDGWTSLFAYAELVAGKTRVNGLFAIGPVTVTGIALGFGINSTVRVPTTTELGRFPLVNRLGTAPDPGGEVPPLTPGQALSELAGPAGWVTPAQGRYWIAGGVEFTVYKFINARVLALVEWGQAGWKAMLAGSTTLSLPPTVPNESDARGSLPQARRLKIGPALGKVIVDFVFVYDSSLSRFSMDSVIAKGSYIIDPAAELTGGISLYVWGKNIPERGITKGFVLSAGGYHPQFPRPAYYPTPPRIGMIWARGPVTIKAQAYAALTDGAFMVGGALAAVYDGHHGIHVQAWFTAHLDALVQWKPFYADIAFGMSIGVAATVKVAFVRIRVSLEIGVSLQLWLPPVGGRAKVKMWFVSFGLGFGAHRVGAPPVPWADFRIQLPAPLRTAPKHGCELPDVTAGELKARTAAGDPLLVRIDGFTVGVESAVPASKITVNGKIFAGSDAARVDIRPMRLSGVVSEQAICILDGRGRPYDWEKEKWQLTATTEGVPQALWGKPLANPHEALKQEGLVPGCLTGLTIQVPPPALGPSVGPVSSEALDVDGLPPGNMPLHDTTVAGPPPVPGEDANSVEVIADTLVTTAGARTEVHQALAALGVAPDSDGPLTRYADLVGSTLTDFPMLTPSGAR
ncbi:DUF6603 domain-containing protein [Streptomyces sp. NPDC001657]|uniref:DUF6603 domain-containing protein n=1 Tax=Streptomyces sp. NPDC001657 TaxID=3154522 RepID=UPI0033171083